MTLAVENDSPRTAEGPSPRSSVYLALAQAFSFPDHSFFESVREGTWTGQLVASLDQLPYRLRTHDLEWPSPTDYDEMQSEYIRLFQVGGRRGPPCPLHEGQYTRDRSQTLQHLIRFYNFFGFRVTECVMPDYLPVQLEFIGNLALDDSHGANGYRRAERDFLKSHLAWTSEFARRASGARSHRFYRSLGTLTSRLVSADQLYLHSVLGGSSDGQG